MRLNIIFSSELPGGLRDISKSAVIISHLLFISYAPIKLETIFKKSTLLLKGVIKTQLSSSAIKNNAMRLVMVDGVRGAAVSMWRSEGKSVE